MEPPDPPTVPRWQAVRDACDGLQQAMDEMIGHPEFTWAPLGPGSPRISPGDRVVVPQPPSPRLGRPSRGSRPRLPMPRLPRSGSWTRNGIESGFISPAGSKLEGARAKSPGLICHALDRGSDLPEAVIMAKKRSRREEGTATDNRILLGWVIRDFYFHALPLATMLDEDWFEAEVKRRIGKPAATPDGLAYYYTKVTERGAVIEGRDSLHVRRKVDGIMWRYEPSEAADRQDACPACGGKHPVIMECHGRANRLFMFCDGDARPRIQVIYGSSCDPRESRISTVWLNTHRSLSPDEIDAWLQEIIRDMPIPCEDPPNEPY